MRLFSPSNVSRLGSRELGSAAGPTLRHNAATELQRAFGLEAAQHTLGHSSAEFTDAIYAERDRAKVIEIMRNIGQRCRRAAGALARS